VSALVGICSYVSYGKGEDRVLKSVMAIIMLYVTVNPLASLAEELLSSDLSFQISGDTDISIEDTDFHENTELAFAQGIKQYVCQQFSLSHEEVSIKIFGFDSIGMKAERIKVVLKGSAAYADHRAIAAKLNECKLGNCEVELDVWRND
jgi:hypothetical protein